MVVCHAHKHGGAPCDQPAVEGKRVCRLHGAGAGAPKGNQNARREGLYSRRASAEMREKIDAALTVEGLTNEIAYVRARLAKLIEDGASDDVIDNALVMLSRLTKAQSAIGKNKRVNQTEIIASVIEELGGQMGLWELMS